MRRLLHRVNVCGLLLNLLVVAVVAKDNGIQCATGWGNDNKLRVIPSEWMNDGYCDCPLDGLDEPNTNACSGSAVGGWPGVPAVRDSR